MNLLRFGILLFSIQLLNPLILTAESNQPFILRVNCGGSTVPINEETLFLADHRYSPESGYGYFDGNKAETTHSISNTEIPKIYQSELWGIHDYYIDVPNGIYRIITHFSENHFKNPKQRVFSIWIEDQLLIEDLDIQKQQGSFQAMTIHHVSPIEDGQIHIEFNASQDQPKISALEIIQIIPNKIPPKPIDEIETFTKDQFIGLSWIANHESDFHSYLVEKSTKEEGPFQAISDWINQPYFIDTDIENNTNYWYRIQSKDYFENISMSVPQIVMANARSNENIQHSFSATNQFIENYHPSKGYGFEGGNLENKLLVGNFNYLVDLPAGHYQISLNIKGLKIDTLTFQNSIIKIQDILLSQYDFDQTVTPQTVIFKTEVPPKALLKIESIGNLMIESILISSASQDEIAPKQITDIKTHLYDFSSVVEWNPPTDTDLSYYELKLISSNSQKSFDFICRNNFYRFDNLDAGQYQFQIRAIDSSRNKGSWSNPISFQIKALTDDDILDLIQKEAFYYFWNEAHPHFGMVRDATGKNYSSTAATGFALASICIGVERGWITYNEGLTRTMNTFKTLINTKNNKKHGLYFHYLSLDGQLSTEGYEKVVSTIDTALLACGVITAGQYFKGEAQQLANQIYQQMNWNAFWIEDKNCVSMGWQPFDVHIPQGEGELLKWGWDYYTDETILVDILAIGTPNPDYSISPKAFYQFQRDWGNLYEDDEMFIYSWSGSLFTHQFAHLFIDFKSLGPDQEDVDWFHNSQLATLNQIKFAKLNQNKYQTYHENSWGMTACVGPDGYLVAGIQPRAEAGNVLGDGTVAPYGAGSSIIFTPTESINALKYFFKFNFETSEGETMPLWEDHFEGGYGLVDSYNVDRKFVAKEHLAIDQGPLLIMIENYRTGLIQKLFMSHPNMQESFNKIGFKKFKKAA